MRWNQSAAGQAITLEGADEIQALALACSELISSSLILDEQIDDLRSMGMEAALAATWGREPRLFALSGRRAHLAATALERWAKGETASPKTHSGPYRRSQESARLLSDQLEPR